MGACGWTISPTPPAPKGSRRACSGSEHGSGPASPTAASTRRSAPGTSSSRWPRGCYLEVVEALDHPAADRAPFGRAVRARSEAGGGWLAWVVAVDDMGPIEQRLGRRAADGHRRRPDGFDLRWKQIGINDVSEDPQLPFFTQWISDAVHHPSSGGSAIRLSSLEIAGDEPTVDAYLGASNRQPLDEVEVRWLSPFDGDTGVVAALFDTPHGEVRID